MNALDLGAKARQKAARARSSRIRIGMVNYLETLADVIAARAQDDHLTLGYKTWQEYLDTEYGAARLKLSPEMQQKAIVELRLAGASQREIGHTLGINQSNVSRALASGSGDASASPDEIYDRDGNLVPPAKSRVVEAMTGAIEDAEQRAEDHRADTPGEVPDPLTAGPVPAGVEGPPASTPAPQDHPDVNASDEPGEGAATATAPEEPAVPTPDRSSTAAGAGPAAPAAPQEQERIEENVCPACLRPLAVAA